uniref:Transmembrane channel-like protein n=1 Tax=Heterorhabditis bacteriophora TaxID=37862 RepID=A0A1I7XIM3_HETBA
MLFNILLQVFSDYGPFGVSNPKALVSKDKSVNNVTIVVTQAIGPNVNWNESTKLNYTTYRLEITKLVTMDLLMTIAAILVIDFFRGLACRYCNMWWFWNLEKTFKQSQVKLKRGSSNFYLMLLLLMLFLCTLPVGYVIASRKPSKSCGPFGSVSRISNTHFCLILKYSSNFTNFRDQPHFYSVITDVLHENLNASLVDAIKYMTSPGIVIPVLLLLLLVIYFLFALVRGLREANADLSTQLMHDDDSQSHPKSIGSVPRSVSSKAFVPSLGSVSEVDHSDVEENDDEGIGEPRPPPLKLTLKQQFLVCIGWSDPKQYERVEETNEIEMEEGRLEGEYSDEAEEEQEDDRRNSESRYLLPPERSSSHTSREKSDYSKQSDIDGKRSREESYVTPSQSSRRDMDERRDGLKMTEIGISSSRTPSYKNNSQPLETEFSVPQLLITEDTLLDSSYRRTHLEFPLKDQDGSESQSSLSRTPSFYGQKEENIKGAVKRLLYPISSQYNTRYGYTSAMMSPIMTDLMSTDEGTDDEKAKLIPDRPPLPHFHKERQSRSHIPRAPRFRISMSPPRKKVDSDSDSPIRRFEMRVEHPENYNSKEQRECHKERNNTKNQQQTNTGESSRSRQEEQIPKGFPRKSTQITTV